MSAGEPTDRPGCEESQGEPAAQEDGVTLVEFVVAALLIVTATAMVGSFVGPFHLLERSAPNDVGVAILEARADTVARTLRSVRPSTWHRGITGTPSELELQLGPADDPAWVRLRFHDDALTVEHLGPGGVAAWVPTGTLLTGLDAEVSRFLLRDRSGIDVDAADPDLAMVGVALVRDGAEVLRLEDLRVVTGGRGSG